MQPAGLGLPAGTYHLVDVATGKAMPATAGQNGVTVPVDVPPGFFQVWRLEPGAGPAEPPATSAASVSSPVGFTAGGPAQGLRVLNETAAGGPPTGDGNVSAARMAGQAAVARWTLHQLGTPGAYIYLQVDPASPVRAASRLELSVTYLATPGQGFQVQYDGTQGAYENGPTVTGPGTGRWVTAQVQLDGVHLDQGENGGADLRLAVQDGGTPLYVHAVTLRPAG